MRENHKKHANAETRLLAQKTYKNTKLKAITYSKDLYGLKKDALTQHETKKLTEMPLSSFSVA